MDPLFRRSSAHDSSASNGIHGLYWVGSAGAVVGAARSLHQNGPTLLLDPYWMGFYLVNYQDGFRRRALVGSLCRMIFPSGVNVVAINVAALVVASLCVALFVRALCRLCMAGPKLRTRLFLFAVCASALTGIFSEVLGDMLQVAMLLFCGVMLLAMHRLGSGKARLWSGLAATAVCFFIHEASAFFLIPALPFFLKARPRLRDFLVPTVLFAALMAVSLRFSVTLPHPTYGAFLQGHAVQRGGVGSTPTFKAEWAFEYHLNFSSRSAFAGFLERCARILVLIFAGLVALSQCLPRRRLERCLYALGAALLFSVPLWLIAHDWGRFFCYTLFLALMSSAVWREEVFDEDEAPGWVGRVAGGLGRVGRMELLQLGVALVLLHSADPITAHIEGLRVADTEAFGCLAVVAVVVHTWQSSRRPTTTTP